MQFTAKINKLALSLLVVTGLFAHTSAALAATSSVTCNAATLNGHTATTVFPVTVWFEWGTNSSAVTGGNGTKTASQTLSANASFSAPLSGLNENTTYYYRAMAQDHIGPLAGAVVSFTTPPCGGQGQLPSVTTNSASNVDNYSATLNEYVDPRGSNGSRWFEYGTSQGNLSNSTSRVNISAPGNGSAYISNLSTNTTYYFRAAGSNDQGTVYGQILSFTTNGGTNGQRPTASTNSASGVSLSDATLNGYVDPNGTNDTVRWFEWGSGYYGFDNSTSQVNISNAGNVSAYLPNLSANTTYRFRVVAQNSYGTSYGTTMTFRTNGGSNGQVPTATTRSASSVDNYSATLNGYVDPNGASDTARWFEYGTSQGNLYNSTSRVNIGYAGDASAYISSLSANRTYYFRIVAQNSQGTTYGQVLSFTTNNGGDNNDQLPTVNTNSASSIDNYSATLNGYVGTNGSSYNTTRWFEYGTSQGNLYNSTSHVNMSNSGSISAYISNLQTNTTYYFRAVAQNSQGTVYGQVLSFTTNGGGGGGYSNLPLVTTRSANNVFASAALINGYVDANGSGSASGWFEWGTNQNLSNTTSRTSIGSGSSNISSNLTGLSQNTTYYYRAVGQNDQGTVRGSILSFTTSNTGNTDDGAAPTAITTLPTQITGTSAMLNSLVLNNGNDVARAWFEWGTTQALARTTSPVSIGTAPSARHAETVYGLVSGTTYYFRVVAENSHGKNYGIIRSFVARSPVVVVTPKPTPKPTTPVRIVERIVEKPVLVHAEGVNSLVMLTITGGSDTITKGEDRTYHVTWTNDSTQNLSNVVLRVLVPQTMTFKSSDDGTFSKADSTLTLELDKLSVGESGETNLVLNGGGTLKVGDLVVTTANMVYTDESSVQGDALAYTTQRVVEGGAVLGASVGAASFPMMLLGWLLLIILVMILIILTMHLYRKLKEGGESSSN
ncbi:MAG TPA: fibronectin type III domain-containing protein [Candidatus Paceibacterota bacterium]|nr:fibronectin type III domain-containing protein [Candidatus Paceibacterota bacterium]